jgi:hypothetical protein
VRGAKRSPEPGSIPLDGEYPLVVPVMSAAGGVGRSTVAALLAATLNQQTADSWDRAVAVFDLRPRSASPWPGWLDHTAERGTGWLAGWTADAEKFAREVRRSTSAMNTGQERPVWVLTDTGPLSPGFSGADPGPRFWAPALRYLRAAVIDADPLEGFRLIRQQAGGEASTTAAWMATPSARIAGVWVTDPSPAGLSRTLEAMTAAEECGLPMRQLVVAVNDSRGHGWASRSRSRRTLLADRVGAIVEIGHDAELRRDDRPSYSSEQLGRRDIADLVRAVMAAGTSPAPAPLPARAPALTTIPVPAPAERTSWHVAHSGHTVPASS